VLSITIKNAKKEKWSQIGAILWLVVGRFFIFSHNSGANIIAYFLEKNWSVFKFAAKKRWVLGFRLNVTHRRSSSHNFMAKHIIPSPLSTQPKVCPAFIRKKGFKAKIVFWRFFGIIKKKVILFDPLASQAGYFRSNSIGAKPAVWL
jgi:hypothetical protein